MDTRDRVLSRIFRVAGARDPADENTEREVEEAWRNKSAVRFLERIRENADRLLDCQTRGGRLRFRGLFRLSGKLEVIYDLVADPLETTNLAQDPRYQTILQNLRQRIDSSGRSGAERGNDRTDRTGLERFFERGDIHSPAGIDCDRTERHTEHGRQARMRVVRLNGGGDRLAGRKLP